MSSFSLHNSSGALGMMHSEFMAFVADDDSLAVIGDWVGRQGYPMATVQQGGPDLFTQMLEGAPAPKMAIIDIDGQSEPLAVVTRLVGLCGPETRLIIIGSTNDVTMYRRMIAAGITDYLVKPMTAELLNQALAAALRGHTAGKPEAKEARVIVMMGTRGGVGTSTALINMAWLLAHELNVNTAVLDLDLQFGTSSLALDMEAGRGLREILGSANRVDGLMIASSLVAESDKLSILSAEDAVDEAVITDASAMTALLKEMRDDFDVILIDLPRAMLPSQKRLLSTANEIVLVTELSLAGIRDTLRVKTALATLGCTGTITIVASRTGPNGGQIDAATFEKGAQLKIDYTLPEDAKAVSSACNAGKALAAEAPSSPLTKALTGLARRLAKVPEDKKKSGGFIAGLFGSKSRKSEVVKAKT